MTTDGVLVVNTEQYVDVVGPAAFTGLPREEIERLHGAVEVTVLDRAEAAADTAYLPLVAFNLVHYNYRWRVHAEGSVRSLGALAPLAPFAPFSASAQPPLFLDDALTALAFERAVDSGLVDGPCDHRLAGLIRGAQLGLVCVVRRRERWPASAAETVFGNGELPLARDGFEPWSRLLIDNLAAL